MSDRFSYKKIVEEKEQEVDEELDDGFLVVEDDFYKEKRNQSISQLMAVFASVVVGFFVFGGGQYVGISLGTNNYLFSFLRLPAYIVILAIIWVPFILKQYTVSIIVSTALLFFQLMMIVNSIMLNG